MISMNKYLNKKVLVICILILTIGVPTSLAYFIDSVNARPDITIQMGRLNTEIVEAINIEGLDINNPKADEFRLKNTGTLKQRVSFKLNNSKNIGNDGLDKLNYEIIFNKSNGEKSKVYSGVMTGLFENSIDVEDERGNKLIVEAEEVLTANIKVTMDKAMPYKYSNQDFKFELVIDANQINKPIE